MAREAYEGRIEPLRLPPSLAGVDAVLYSQSGSPWYPAWQSYKQLMQQCFKLDPGQRPTSMELVRRVTDMQEMIAQGEAAAGGGGEGGGRVGGGGHPQGLQKVAMEGLEMGGGGGGWVAAPPAWAAGLHEPQQQQQHQQVGATTDPQAASLPLLSAFGAGPS
jgi:hypothetical protein